MWLYVCQCWQTSLWLIDLLFPTNIAGIVQELSFFFCLEILLEIFVVLWCYYRFNTGVFLKIVFFYIFLVIRIQKFTWRISALPAAADTVRLWDCDSMTLWHCDSVTCWHCDTVTPWHFDTVRLRLRDTMTLWNCDTVTLWHCWQCDSVTLWQLVGGVETERHLGGSHFLFDDVRSKYFGFSKLWINRKVATRFVNCDGLRINYVAKIKKIISKYSSNIMPP